MTEEKQELVKLLRKYGFAEYTNPLYDENYSIEDWAKQYGSRLVLEVPGLAQILTKERPTGLPNELGPRSFYNLTEGDPSKMKRYEREQQQLAKEIEEKSRLAEEYKRGADWSLKLPQGTPFVGGMDIANPYAAKHASQGHTGQAVTNEIAGKAAGILDFVPVFGLGAPAIRTMQKWAADEPVLTGETAVDWGLGALGFAKKIPGVRGFATKVLNTVSKPLGKSTEQNIAKEALKGKGKVVKDLMDNDIAYGVTRKGLLPGREEMDIPEQKDYDKAVQYVIDKYKNDWKLGLNRPMMDDPVIKRDAFNLWNKQNMESLGK